VRGVYVGVYVRCMWFVGVCALVCVHLRVFRMHYSAVQHLSVAASQDKAYLSSDDRGVGSWCRAQYTLAANSSAIINMRFVMRGR
jgi:hypothetical protein